VPLARGQGLKTKFSTVALYGGDLGPRPRRFSPSGFFFGFLFLGIDLANRSHTPPLEWTSFPSLITAVLITPKGAESPGSRRIGVIGALLYFLPSETI